MASGRENPLAVPPDAIHLISGVVYQVVRQGEGDERPGPKDIVQARYRVWTDDGRLLADTGAATTFSVPALGPGPAEALQLVGVGGRARAWVPPHLVTASADHADVGTWIYEFDLEGFTRTEEPPTIPPELRSPRLDS